jgi:hypothetical protein
LLPEILWRCAPDEQLDTKVRRAVDEFAARLRLLGIVGFFSDRRLRAAALEQAGNVGEAG